MAMPTDKAEPPNEKLKQFFETGNEKTKTWYEFDRFDEFFLFGQKKKKALAAKQFTLPISRLTQITF